MKIGVTAQGESLEAEVEPRFGRCPHFVIVDSETMAGEGFSNPAADAAGGAGPQAVQSFLEHGAEVVLTGRVGPNAEEALQAADLAVVTRVSGTVREAVEAYLATKG